MAMTKKEIRERLKAIVKQYDDACFRFYRGDYYSERNFEAGRAKWDGERAQMIAEIESLIAKAKD